MTTSLTHGYASGLLERLMEVVRPEFRGEVFYPPADSHVFVQGTCRIPSCGIALSFASRRLCQGHYQRWIGAGRPELDEWTEVEDLATQQRRTPSSCQVRECNRATKSSGLCHRHSETWMRYGRPDLDAWLARTLYTAPRASFEQPCQFPECPRWTDGPTRSLCLAHYERWRTQGRMTPLTDWFAHVVRRRNPHVRLHDLGRQVRLEIQYGLQRRFELGSQHTAPRVITQAVRWIRESGVHSLLDFDDAEWKAFCRPKPANYDTLSLAFMKDTRFELHAVLIAADPWADQYPRDIWDLKHLGLNTGDVRHLRFGSVVQPWLKDLVKRWCRWRLTRELNPSTVAIDVRGCSRLAEYLALAQGAQAGPETLTREWIEAWLAALQIEVPDPITRSSAIHSISAFLKDVHRHEWQPDLPRNAFIYEDSPKRPHAKPRFIPEHIMRQLESPASLTRFPSTDGLLIVEIVMACGLRLKDARTLPFDCVIRYQDNPYLAWLNRKMRDRPAFFPISEELAGKILAQQKVVLERFPGGSPWLFPAIHSNIDGSKHASSTRLRQQLDLWLGQLNLTDELDRPVRVTFHQFRHTLGTRLINADVPQPVVQALLDHMSPQMTAVYARLHNETKREHWLKAVKVNAAGEPAAIATDHPLAGAAWAKLSMVRAKVTLPNGYCGAPVQTDCEFANPCLDCKFFITTVEFLGQHRRQRDETRQMIDDAEQAGLRRVVEKNTRTLTKLTTIIDALESTQDGQVVVGGKVEDLDATG